VQNKPKKREQPGLTDHDPVVLNISFFRE